jgi:hypothetical protein
VGEKEQAMAWLVQHLEAALSERLRSIRESDAVRLTGADPGKARGAAEAAAKALCGEETK